MQIKLIILCLCGNELGTVLERDEDGKIYISENIEKVNNGIMWCSCDKPNSMLVNCYCGRDTRLHF